MNIIAILSSLMEVLSSTLVQVGSYWVRTVFGKLADITAFISVSGVEAISIFIKERSLWDEETYIMVENPKWNPTKATNELNPDYVPLATNYKLQTKKVPFITKMKGVTMNVVSHTDTNYDAGGPVRFCSHCGCTLVEVFDSIEDKIHYVHPAFGVAEMPTMPDENDKEYKIKNRYKKAMDAYYAKLDELSICQSGDKVMNGEFIYNAEDMTCGIANHKHGEMTDITYMFKSLYKSKIKRMYGKFDLLEYLCQNGETIKSILTDNLDGRDNCQMEDGVRTDKNEYLEPCSEDTSEGVSTYNEGSAVSDIQPSKLLTENKGRNALECVYMDYTRGKVTLADLEARIFTTLRNGSIDLEEADYYRELTGLPTGKDPEPPTPKKYKRGVIGIRVIKAPKVAEGVTVTKVSVEKSNSPNYRWIMTVLNTYMNRNYILIRGDRASNWIIKDQTGKSHLIHEYHKSDLIMKMVKTTQDLVQKDWTKMINRI